MARIEYRRPDAARRPAEPAGACACTPGHDPAGAPTRSTAPATASSTSPAARSSRCWCASARRTRGAGSTRSARRCPAPSLRAGTRTNGVVGMGITPNSIVELWIQTLAKHGIQSLWIFDCLHDVDQMLRRGADRAGRRRRRRRRRSTSRQSPVHTDEYYADLIERLRGQRRAGHDHPRRRGRRARPRARAPWIRLMHERRAATCRSSCTSTTAPAMANLNHIIGVEEGVTILHTRRVDAGQRRLDAVDRGDRRQHAPPRPRGRDRRQPARRGGRALRRRSPTTRATSAARRSSTRVADDPAAVPRRHDGHAAQPAQAATAWRTGCRAVLEEAIRVRAEMG